MGEPGSHFPPWPLRCVWQTFRRLPIRVPYEFKSFFETRQYNVAWIASSNNRTIMVSSSNLNYKNRLLWLFPVTYEFPVKLTRELRCLNDYLTNLCSCVSAVDFMVSLSLCLCWLQFYSSFSRTRLLSFSSFVHFWILEVKLPLIENQPGFRKLAKVLPYWFSLV